MTGTGVPLPLWAEIVVAALVLAGAAVALLGSFGMLRLKTFFERVHVPAIIATLGCWCVTWGTVLFFSIQQGELAIFPLLTALFIAITVPIPTIFLMRASLFRARQMGKDVPPSVSRIVPPGVRDS
ncbi:Na(+) H(+) antiporter subunit G [Polaromonas sp. CG9_12]|uniref:monovalent cation/H(+) antiporter subunit G n=1 Tax=Polaromonas sp. CG_9.11 TaxID=2787730 RepID=UPI0004DDD350|nr:monovalent cation/H(+) antiporter subunit G [Polaromonas sp. CG_9.11]MBG6074374.1 multicomponent K+:H+ antiporter subunit G [Polaromonas sp. CG_9.11]CDS54508.1 Na(+) H(+) antiporter subunit G [Polaromonas sp. CG9_12]